MSAPIFQRTIVDDNGTIQPSASVEVRNEANSELAVVYSDRALTEPKTNPFSPDANGFVEFYAPRGEYRITATFGADSIVWRYVQLIDTEALDDSIAAKVAKDGDTMTGSLGIGGNVTGVIAGVSVDSKFCVKQEGTDPVAGFVKAEDTTAGSGSVTFACRSRGTLASPTAVQSGDALWNMYVAGHDGTDLALAAEIAVEVDGTPGSNDMPGRIVLKTTPDGQQAPVERVRIDASGNVGIGTSSPYSKLRVEGTAQFTGDSTDTPSSGTGIEIVGAPNGAQNQILAFNRGASTFQALDIGASSITLSTGATTRLRIEADGDIVNTGVFYYNARTITASITLSATDNAMSIGPITISDPAVVTVPDGGNWAIL
jgi:hypothetical protein